MKAYEGFRDRWDKLPKWANASLLQMAREIKQLEARVTELQNQDLDATDTRALPGGSQGWYPLPSHQQYEFDLDDKTTIQVGVRKEWNGLWLSVNAVHGQLEVAPRSSNLIYVRGAQD